MAAIYLFRGVTVNLLNRTYTVFEYNKHETIMVDTQCNLIVPFQTKRLSDYLISGEMKIIGYRNISSISTRTLVYLSLEARIELLRRLRYIQKCFIESIDKPVKNLKEIINLVAKEMADHNPPSERTLKTWIKSYKKYEETGQIEVLM